MTQKRHMAKILGLCLLTALGLMTFAAGAQANGVWTIGLSPISNSEAVAGAMDGSASFLAPGLGVTIDCESGSFGGTIELNGHSHGLFEFSACALLENETCTVDDIHMKVLGLVALHDEEVYVVFKPLEGGSLATLLFLGAECILPEEIEVSGSFATPIGSHAVTQLFSGVSHATNLLLKAGLFFGEESLIAHFDLLVGLSGPQAGSKWGAI